MNHKRSRRSTNESEVGDDGQVIGSSERETAAMNVDAFEFERRIVVDVVQVQDRKHARVRARSAETLLGFGAV